MEFRKITKTSSARTRGANPRDSSMMVQGLISKANIIMLIGSFSNTRTFRYKSIDTDAWTQRDGRRCMDADAWTQMNGWPCMEAQGDFAQWKGGHGCRFR